MAEYLGKAKKAAGLLNVGRVAISQGMNHANREGGEITPDEMMNALARHRRGDWGNTCKEDGALNTEAMVRGSGRVISSYTSAKGEVFWIETDADHATTTMYLPDEY